MAEWFLEYVWNISIMVLWSVKTAWDLNSPLAHFIQKARIFVKSQPVRKPNVNFNLKGNYNTVKHAYIVKCCLGTKTGCFILHKHNLLLNEFEILKMYINLYICQFI